MHIGDTIFIFCLALIIFGPKKLPEIGRQIGKLMVEFRRASNEFKMQIEEELRASEESERQKEITAAKTMLPTLAPAVASSLLSEPASDEATVDSATPAILPPGTGLPVNHTFSSAEECNYAATLEPSSTEPAFQDAGPESAFGFEPALNTASNGAIAEIPAAVDFPTETFEPAAPKLEEPESEKAPDPVHHG